VVPGTGIEPIRPFPFELGIYVRPVPFLSSGSLPLQDLALLMRLVQCCSVQAYPKQNVQSLGTAPVVKMAIESC
jgi:hypothetical protein